MSLRAKHLLFSCFLLFLSVSCSKQQSPSVDSVLVSQTHEQYDTAHPRFDSAGAATPMDSLKARQEKDEAKLQRFTPVEVVKIYDDYRPLRNEGTTKPQINAFLASHKITLDELRAVLSEGDRLGWGK